MNARDINQTYDLRSLVERYTELHHSGHYDIGRCPLPGCGSQHDALTLKQTPDGWRWYCRRCGDGKYHTPIDFVMRLHGLDFKGALSQMGGQVEHFATPTEPRQPARPALVLPGEAWQRAAWHFVDAASDTLLYSPSGQVGRDYLKKRGLTLDTAGAWNIGFVDTMQFFDKEKQSFHGSKWREPALVIPWHDNQNISLVKYRRINATKDKLRTNKPEGTTPVLFGLNYASDNHHTLLLVEGEINALSVWQVEPVGVTVLSIGSEGGAGGAGADILRAVAAHYRRVFVWLDDADKAQAARALVPGSQALRSPNIDGVKWDANQMLQARALDSFLSRVLAVRCEI